MIAAILDHDFRIADLTGHNPNVFYELALARAAERPVIMMKPVVSPDETSGASRIVVGARIVDGHARHWKYIKVNDRREGFQQIPLTPEIG